MNFKAIKDDRIEMNEFLWKLKQFRDGTLTNLGKIEFANMCDILWENYNKDN